MSWSYNSSTLSTDFTMQIRLYIGDVSSSDQLLQDEEIEYVETLTTGLNLASAECCEMIAARWGRLADVDNEGLSVKASQRHDHYMAMAKDFRKQAKGYATIFVGGRSKATKESRASDSDYVEPWFRRGMDDFPGTVDSESSTD